MKTDRSAQKAALASDIVRLSQKSESEVKAIVDKYRKLMHFEEGMVDYRWLGDMARELLGQSDIGPFAY